jgi:uncharacterized protein YqfA (UPF0365 family)
VNSNDDLYGLVLLGIIIVLFLVTFGMGVHLWAEAFAAGNKSVVFVTGGLAVLALNLSAILIGRNFKITRRQKGKADE